MHEQLSIFDDVLVEYKITKPVRLISFFSGIEAQYKALSYLGQKLGVSVESYKTCEWAYNSIIACNAIHNRDFTDYSEGKTKEEMIDRIKGISVDYNKPLTDEQLKKKPLSWIKKAYNSCVANHNLVNIMDVHASDLEIVDTEKYDYILTYSFPCQDLSLAGQRAGMDVSQSEGGTRSGLLWEVERILNECVELGTLPNILVMENVIQIHSEKDMPNFRKWMIALEELGYNSYWADLNGKDYGIPQNRVRTFMVSVLGREFSYKFPLPFKRELNLIDMLEDNVDEKYYLSQRMIDYLTGINQRKSKYDRGAVFERNLDLDKDCASTITTCAGQRPTDNFVIEDEDGIPIQEATKKGYKVAKIGDGVDVGSRMHTHRGTVQDGLSQTLKTTCEVGVVVESEFTETEASLFTEDGNVRRYINSEQIDEFGEGDMATTTFPNGYGHGPRTHKGISITLNTIDRPVVKKNLRIRKLTPKEAMRLMSFQDVDCDHMYEIGLADAAIFHCAGDSICVNLLLGIFARLYEVSYKDCEILIKDYIKEIKNGN